jgi:hypothetical protein
LKVTKTLVKHTKAPASGQAFLRDAEVRRLALRATPSGTKSSSWKNSLMGAPSASPVAAAEVIQNRHRVNPVAERRAGELKSVTLANAVTDLRGIRKPLKACIMYDYRPLMTVAFPDWAELPLASISKDMMQVRHHELGAAR